MRTNVDSTGHITVGIYHDERTRKTGCSAVTELGGGDWRARACKMLKARPEYAGAKDC